LAIVKEIGVKMLKNAMISLRGLRSSAQKLMHIFISGIILLMLSPETTEYYDNWMAQFAAITGDQPEDYFAKFKILYPIQNRLYADSSADLLSKGLIAARGNNPNRSNNKYG